MFFFFFFFFLNSLNPIFAKWHGRGKDYVGARRAEVGMYKGAAISTAQGTTTDPDKVLTQKEKMEKQTTPMNLLPLPFAIMDDMSPSLR